MDISSYIEDGANTIIFNPTVCLIIVYVELVEGYGKNTCFDKGGEVDND